MIAFDHSGNSASAEWLTSVLTTNGFLTSGEVAAVTQRSSRIGTTLTSTFYELEVRYSEGADHVAPSRFLLKIGKPESFRNAAKEAAFYEKVRERAPSEVVTSFGTAVDEAARSAVILIDDRIDCSSPRRWPLPPDVAQCEIAVSALASMHARWWNSIGVDEKPFTRLVYGEEPDGWAALCAPFYAALGDGLSPLRRATLERVTDLLPRCVNRRMRERSNALTLVHGDAHFWNFLYPADPLLRAILIDWQSYFVHFGAYDLAYMIALHWFPERRQRFEKRLLHVYHDELQRHSIDYSFDDLWYDYRLQVAAQVLSPVVQCVQKLTGAIWWPHMERAFSAFDDLDCREILGG